MRDRYSILLIIGLSHRAFDEPSSGLAELPGLFTDDMAMILGFR